MDIVPWAMQKTRLLKSVNLLGTLRTVFLFLLHVFASQVPEDTPRLIQLRIKTLTTQIWHTSSIHPRITYIFGLLSSSNQACLDAEEHTLSLNKH